MYEGGYVDTMAGSQVCSFRMEYQMQKIPAVGGGGVSMLASVRPRALDFITATMLSPRLAWLDMTSYRAIAAGCPRV